MTAMATQTYDLARAAALAGNGGQVSRSDITYTVIAENGEFRLRQYETSRRRPLDDFIRTEWTVVRTGEAAPNLTVAQFFAALPSGTHVRRGGSQDTYVWSGRTAGEPRRPVLVNMRYGSDTTLELTDRDNDWAAVLDESGAPVVESDFTVRMLARLRNTQQSYESMVEDNNKLRLDWSKLNEFINGYANETNMCSDYERRLEAWNEEFALLELEGRKRTFEISVRVDASYYVTVPVEATNEDAAHDAISDMSSYDVMEHGSWSSPDSLDHEVSN